MFARLTAVIAVVVLEAVFVVGPSGGVAESASAQRGANADVHLMAATSCFTLSGVNLIAGSTLLSATSGQLHKSDDGAALYGVGVAPDTTIVSVSNSSTSTMSVAAALNETSTTLTICPRGTGSVTCTTVSGMWRFNPGLLSMPRAVTVTEDMKVNGCTTSPGNISGSSDIVPHVIHFNPWTSKTPTVQLSCADFEQKSFTESDVATTGKIAWNTPKARTSIFSFGGIQITNPNGTLEISFPNAGGTVSVNGGYAGSFAQASLFANPNLFSTGKCTSIAGVESLSVLGSVTFGQPAS